MTNDEPPRQARDYSVSSDFGSRRNGTISWCCISNNATTGGGKSGGGVSFTSGRGSIDHSIVAGNTIGSSSWGGGIGGKSPSGPVTVDTCLVYGNEDKSGSGGGIGFQNASVEITVRNCTVTGNKCSNGNGHGLYFNDCSGGANLVLVNDILSGNVSGSTECNTFIAKKYFDGTASSHCLITGSQEQFNGDIYKDAKVRGLFANASSVLSADPGFVDAASRNYHLAEGSPAIRVGTASAGISTDLDGIAFAGSPSLGCYEFPLAVEPPVFAPVPGTLFASSTNVTLTCATEGATIRYTTDGSDPTEASTLYEGPLTLSATTTLKARAFKTDGTASDIVVATYNKIEVPVPPVLGTVTVISQATTASISGTITSLGNNGATACDVYFALGTAAAEKIATGVTGSFTSAILNLTAETAYDYTLSVSNNAATPMGAQTAGSFTTTKFRGIEPVTGSPSATRQIIQEAIDAAPAGTVTLAEGLFEIDQELAVRGGVTLRGQGWEKTVIRPASGANIRCATLTDASTLTGVTLTGGKSPDAGAGAWVKNGTLSWCCITNNATTGGGNSGGGVSFTSGQGSIDHSIIADNTIGSSSWGAGVGGKSPAGPVAIDVCLIYGNRNNLGSGGGVGFDEPKTAIAIRSCTVTDNWCSMANGHGVYFNNCKSGASLTLIDDIVSGNGSGSDECNLFIQWSAFDSEASSNCLVTGSRGDFSDAIYRDGGMRELIADVLSVAPDFADAANRDYRLAKGSAAIAAGVAYTGLRRDLGNHRFATPPSLGCYENVIPGLKILMQ